MATHYKAPNHVTESLPSADYVTQMCHCSDPDQGNPPLSQAPSNDLKSLCQGHSATVVPWQL
jgi:hypothetical protein